MYTYHIYSKFQNFTSPQTIDTIEMTPHFHVSHPNNGKGLMHAHMHVLISCSANWQSHNVMLLISVDAASCIHDNFPVLL